GPPHRSVARLTIVAPEEGPRMECLPLSQHIARGGLPLTFGDDPVFDPDVFAGMRIGPARDVARGVDSGDAGFEVCAYGDTTIERKAGLFGQRQARADADANDDHICLQHVAALERSALAVDRDHGIPEMKDDAVLLVQGAHEIAHAGPQHALHRPLLGGYDVNLDIARSQCSRGFEADKAGADHDRAARATR